MIEWLATLPLWLTVAVLVLLAMLPQLVELGWRWWRRRQ
jgi:hypothetical protein